MKQISMGIIGLGKMFRNHFNQLKDFEQVRIVAVCDVNEQVLSEEGEFMDIPPEKRYSDYKSLIQDPDVNVVVSITPNHVHADILKTCMLSGKAIMAEKPFTRTYEEALELKELYREYPIPCMINFTYQFQPAFRYAKYLIETGRLGKIRHVSHQYLQGFGAPKYNRPLVWRYRKAMTGTGTLGDLGSHMIDMARFLIGEFIEVSAQLQTFVHERMNSVTGQLEKVDVDDFCSFQARLEGDVMAVFQTTRNAVGSANQHEVSVYGDLGTIHASTLSNRQLVWLHDREEYGEIVKATEIIEVPESFVTTMWDEFISYLEGNSKGSATFMDGFINQEILEAIVLSDAEKRTITVSSVRPSELIK